MKLHEWGTRHPALYAGLGFVVAGRRVGYYREPVEDALLMRLELGWI
jgi:ribosomal-protein-alanine N-acetyltransferase